jgi:hypothetical protein
MAYYDLNQSGTVDLSEFLSQFYRLYFRIKTILGEEGFLHHQSPSCLPIPTGPQRTGPRACRCAMIQWCVV